MGSRHSGKETIDSHVGKRPHVADGDAELETGDAQVGE